MFKKINTSVSKKYVPNFNTEAKLHFAYKSKNITNNANGKTEREKL